MAAIEMLLLLLLLLLLLIKGELIDREVATYATTVVYFRAAQIELKKGTKVIKIHA